MVGAIAPKLQQAEIERAKRKPTDSLDAYDYFLRGIACSHRVSQEATRRHWGFSPGRSSSNREFAAPYGAAALCYVVRKLNGWPLDRTAVMETDRLAALAAEFGQDARWRSHSPDLRCATWSAISGARSG